MAPGWQWISFWRIMVYLYMHPKKDRKHEIAFNYLAVLDRHFEKVKAGEFQPVYETSTFAKEMYIDETHLSDIVKEVLGKSPCTIYEEKLVGIVKVLLMDRTRSINDIAYSLDYDPSNFTKFFKRFTGTTPKKYRTSMQYPAAELPG